MKQTIFSGACVALVTPMNDDHSINFKKLDELVEFQIENGTDAICACGTTGEASTLTTTEHIAVIERVVKDVRGRVPVIAGTGSNDTAYGIRNSISAEKVGADALLLVTPYYNKASQKGLVKHFTAIADSVNIPIILYNVPGRTSTNIQPATVKKLAEHPNIVAIKEASGDLGQVSQIAALCGDDIDIYSGEDNLIVPILSVGGKGVISVLSDVVPKVAHDIASLYLQGRVEESRQLQLEYYDLCKALFYDVNPIPVKEALNLMGMNVGPCRLPLCEMEDEPRERMIAVMKKHGLI